MALNRDYIQNIRFDIQKKGYSTEQVDNFLDTILAEWDAVQKEMAELKANLEQYRSMERKLTNALVNAEETAENIVDKARERANGIIAEANAYAKTAAEKVEKEELSYRDECIKEREKYLYQANMLKDFTEEYKSRIRSDLAIFAQKFETVYSFDEGIAENNPKVMEIMKEDIGEPAVMEEPSVQKAEDLEERPETASEEEQDASVGEKQSEEAVERESEAKEKSFDMEAIMQNLPENEDELKAMIDEIL